MTEPARPIGPVHAVVARRSGDPPVITSPSRGPAFPHQQITQIAQDGLQDQVVARTSRLPGVDIGDSCVSVPGARAFRTPRAAHDLTIAATARATGRVVVSADEGAFVDHPGVEVRSLR